MEPSEESPVVVARIVKPHGIHGEVILQSFSDVDGRIETTPTFLMMDHGKVVRELEVETRRFFSGRCVVRFQGFPTRTEAETLRGMELAVPGEEIGELPEDHFFVHDLVGMSVRLIDGKEVGKVMNILRTGGVDLLEVGEKGEILIPFAEGICTEIDPENRVIVIDPPEGLLQLNAR